MSKTKIIPAHQILLCIFTFVFFTVHVNSQPSSNQEKTILLQLKQQLSTTSPFFLNHWTSSSDQCTWPEISCTHDNSVSAIRLVNLNISKPIPPFICDLKNLTFLDVNYNLIPGPFPTLLYNCTNLEYLDLSFNFMNSSLPNDINRLSPKLQYFNITANFFTGDIPPAIGGLKQLKELQFASNAFHGSFPAEIGDLTNLESLILNLNKFAPQEIPSSFTKLKKLKYIWMSEINLIGEIPESIGNMSALEVLDLSVNGLSGNIPNSLFQTKNLTIVYLYTNRLSGEIPQIIESFNLEVLDLSNNSLTGKIPENFGELTKMTGLSLFMNQLSGNLPIGIGKLPVLVDVKLFGNSLSGEIPPDFGRSSMLRDFQVSQNHFTGKLPEALCYNKVLLVMLAFNNNLTGELPESLGNCNSLRAVRVEKNRLTGKIPDGLWTAKNLSTFLLNDNLLTGQLPERVASNLSQVDIRNNQFSGGLPAEMGTWYNLIVFRASNNLFTGKIPEELTVLPKLTELLLDGNKLSGSFPSNIVSWNSLTTLKTSRNQISGQIPAALGLLPNLIDLDLSSNLLSGEIPPEIGNLKLTSLNLSSNRLTGRIPVELENAAFDRSFLSNPGLCASDPSVGLGFCKGKTGKSDKLPVKLLAALASVGGVTVLVAALYSLFVLRSYRKRKQELVLTWKLTSFHKLDFTEADIVPNLTEKNTIGSGGSGQVYLVPLNRSGNYVAVKKIWNNQKLDHKLEKEFLAEVQILGTVRHSNIVKLLCCISSEESKLLVYEYMESRSLDIWLQQNKRLSNVSDLVLEWPKRLQIAIGAARGLCYMHHDCSPPIIHRDVKSSNVLLDSCFNAKIVDFGLARILAKPGDNTVTAVAGSFGYIAPEYARTTKVNEKIDVYSFGVILLELVTGKEANYGDEDSCLADWAWRRIQQGYPIVNVLDEAIKEPQYLDEMSNVFKLGIFCTSTFPSSRPTMKQVLQILLQCNNTHKGLVTLQRQFLSDICKRKKKAMFSVDEGMTEMREAVQCKRILLVLDDVDNRDQVDALLGMKDLLYPGSKVIVTTRNKRLLRPFDVHKIYEFEALNRDESVELLSWHAFGQDCPIKGFEMCSEQVAIHCGGLPLALEVLGATLAGRNIDIWKSTIQKLETIPNHQILRKLTISYESLEDDHDKNLFLHLACFFIGKDRDLAVTILNRCNFYTVIGIENLIDRNFIKVGKSNSLIMHQMIRDMGRDIVRQESPLEPGKRSRLWRSKDSFNVLIQNRATQTIQGIILDMDMLKESDIVSSSFFAKDFKKHKIKNFLNYPNPQRVQFKQKRFVFFPWHLSDAKEATNELVLGTDVFANMQKLKLLQFDHVELQGSFDVFPKRLRWLRWSELQLECMPIDFPLESLVVIELHRSSLRRIWHGVKFLKDLKIFDLSHSYELLRTPDFSGLPNLEKLILRYCTSLIELHETIGCLESLILLNLKNCKNLQRLPDSICMLKCLVTLNISGCLNLEYVPMDLDKMDSLRELYADEIAVHQMISTPEEVQPWYGFLRSWMLKGKICPKVSHISLPNSLVTLSLANCNLSNDAFPVAFSSLSLLQNLDLSENPICCLPKGIIYLTGLQKLEVEGCEKLRSLVGLPNVEHLNVTNCWSLEKISYQSRSSRLKDLLVSNCAKLVEIDGNFKLEPLRNTEAEMLCKLGLSNLASMDNVMINLTSNILSYYRIHGKGWTPTRKTKKVVLQVLYQPGVFSTFLPGEHVPSWFSSKYTKESHTSFKVPTCTSTIEGLSFCIVYKRSVFGLSAHRPPRLTPPSRIAPLAMHKAQRGPIRYRPVENKPYESTFDCPCITVNNLTRSVKWSYQPLFYGVPEGKEGMMWLSHWKLENQLGSDDILEITVTSGDGIRIVEFGLKILHVEGPNVQIGEPSCEDARGEKDIVNPFWDVVLKDASSKNTCSVRLPPTYRPLRVAREPFLEKALKRNMSDYN